MFRYAPSSWHVRRICALLAILRHLLFYTPWVPKWLSMFLTLARYRPVDHWPSSCKYDFENEYTQLLWNATPPPRRCRRLAKIYDFEPQISSWANEPNNHFGTEGVYTKQMGRGHDVDLDTSCIYSNLPQVVTKAKCGIEFHILIFINDVCNMWQITMTY
jgi:hypothetical protein